MLKRVKVAGPVYVATSLIWFVGCSAQRAADVSRTEAVEAPSSADELIEEATRPDDRIKEGAPSFGSGLGPMGPQVLIGSQVSAKGGPPRVAKLPKESEALLIAIDTPYQIFDDQGSYVHVAAWHTDGEPAKDATVYVGATPVGKTSELGSLVFLYPPKGSAKKSAIGANMIRVVDAKDLDVQGSVPFRPNLRTASFASDHLFVYTDRGVYRPGERVRVRSIGWHLKQDYEPLVEREVEFLLEDARGEVVGGAKRTTDEFGVASLDIPIPVTAPEGLYSLRVAYKGERQTARLQVRAFKPPNVKIEHDLGRFITRAQRELAFDVSLTDAQGGAFDQGELRVSAEVNGAPVVVIERDVTGQGPHRVELEGRQLDKLRARLSDGQWVKVKIAVTDRVGRRDELVREMRFAVNPYVAVLELDKDQYSTGDAVEVIAKLKDLDGVPLRDAAVELDVGGERVEVITDSAGTAQFSLVMGARAMNIGLFIDGVTSPIATHTLNWVAPRAMVSHIAAPIIKERRRAKVKVRFPADIKPAEEVVHMDVVDTSGAIVNAVLLPIKETSEGYVAVGEFSAPTWGSMLLTFFALGERRGVQQDPSRPHHSIGLMTEGQNLVVHPDRELEIVLDGVPDVVAPGGEVKVAARIARPDGTSVVASVGASLVDGRIMAMKDPLEITPMDHFYEPTLRTMSTTGSKILSWPVVSRNWGGRMMDVALPPFPFLDGGRVSVNAHGGMAGEFAEDEGAADNFGGMPPSPSKKAMKPGKGAMMAPSLEADAADELMDSDAMVASNSDRGRRKSDRARKEDVKITIRDRFPETSLWRAHMRAEGTMSVDLQMPDSIAAQELVLVASDRRGGVGVARHTIRVEQAVFARADFPARLHVGERVKIPVSVRNGTEQDADFKIAFEAKGLSASLETRTLRIPANQTALTFIEVTASSHGDTRYNLSVASGKIQDIVRGEVFVSPAGAYDEVTVGGVAGKGRAFESSFEVAASSTGSESFLHVSLPTVTTAMAGVLDVDQVISEQPLSVTADLATAALVLRYATAKGIDSPMLARLRDRVTQAVSMLALAQHDEGSFSYWRNGRQSVYATTWALEGMLEALELDVPVHSGGITHAADWLASQVSSSGEVEVDDIAFWEGGSERVRVGVAAQVFDVLTKIPKSMRSDLVARRIDQLAGRFSTYLKQDTLDPLIAGRALQGLAREGALDQGVARAAVRKLLDVRDRRHWEPSWFNAYGGTVEATAAMIGAMTAIDREGYKVELRDALMWVLSTRDSWGRWHNERGTAAAVRALLLAGRPHDQVGGELVVKLDGEVVHAVKIDPADPFMSAPQLEHLSLGRGLPAGEHRVRVEFNGAPLAATITTRSWRETRRTSFERGEVALRASAASELDSKSEGAMSVDIALPKDRVVSDVRIAPSGLIELDLGALARMVEDDTRLTRLEVERGYVTLTLAPGVTSFSAKLPARVLREGEGTWPALMLERGGEVVATVSAGPLSTRF